MFARPLLLFTMATYIAACSDFILDGGTVLPGYQISNGVFLTLPIIGLSACQKACLHRTTCLSLGYNRDTLQCFLGRYTNSNVSTGDRKQVYIEPDWGRTFPESLGPCISRPCSLNELCVNLRNGNHACITEKLQPDCLALLETGITQSGVYNVSLTGTDTTAVLCDMETDGGGWTVFQKRVDGTTDFYRGWDEYRDGFGDVNHEFWLGNDKLHNLTSECDTELRVDMEDFENNSAYAQYEKFAIGNAADNYRLEISGYSGDAGDSLASHNGNPFTTKDNDNDNYHQNCATMYEGAWWYTSCHSSHLNGLYLSGSTTLFAKGVAWDAWKGLSYSLKSTKMMIRRVTKT